MEFLIFEVKDRIEPYYNGIINYAVFALILMEEEKTEH